LLILFPMLIKKNFKKKKKSQKLTHISFPKSNQHLCFFLI
jgi:hypothetical protein